MFKVPGSEFPVFGFKFPYAAGQGTQIQITWFLCKPISGQDNKTPIDRYSVPTGSP